MDTSNHRPMMDELANYADPHQRQFEAGKSSTDFSRRSIDWRDSGIVIDEDDHLFCNFDTRSSINSECNLSNVSSLNLPATSCCPSQRTIFEQDDDGDTILHLAVVGFTLEKVKDLINLCDLNAINNMMQTPLHVAVLANRPEMVRLLVESRAQLSVHDRRGNTPLHLASQRGLSEIVEIILLAVAGKTRDSLSVQQMIETCNFDGYTSLHLAAISDRRNIIELLVVKYGASLNCKDSKSGETIMHKALRQYNVELVAFILNLCEQHCNDVDFAGRHPLETIQVLQEAHPRDLNRSTKLAQIEALIEASIRQCIAKGGCCNDRQLTRTTDYSSCSSSESDYESN